MVLCTTVPVRLSPLLWLDTLVSIFWIVGITITFNLLDNMDGLATGVAVFYLSLLLG